MIGLKSFIMRRKNEKRKSLMIDKLTTSEKRDGRKSIYTYYSDDFDLKDEKNKSIYTNYSDDILYTNKDKDSGDIKLYETKHNTVNVCQEVHSIYKDYDNSSLYSNENEEDLFEQSILKYEEEIPKMFNKGKINEELYKIEDEEWPSNLKNMSFEEKSLFKEEKKSFEENRKINYKCNSCNVSDNKTCIILSCSHIFHIECMIDYQEKEININDKNFLRNYKCKKCDNEIEMEDILYINNKYNKLLKEDNNEENIEILEEQIRKFEKELEKLKRNKLEIELKKMKSKQIVKLLNELMLF